MMPISNAAIIQAIEPMQVDMIGEENENEMMMDHPIGGGGGPAGNPDPSGEAALNIQVENPTLDLETYIQGYSGLARIYRLLFIATHCPSLRIEALKMAITFVTNSYNVPFYISLHKKLAEAQSGQRNNGGETSNASGGTSANLPDIASAGSSSSNNTGASSSNNYLMDLSWIDTKNKKSALKLEKLDSDLKQYRSNSIKESIRRGLDDLGDHYLDCGDLSGALKCYSRARDYCTSGRHVVTMCINVIKVSVYLKNWSYVISYVNKALSAPDFNDLSNVKGLDHQNMTTRLHCAYGLAELATKQYKSAAKKFLKASLDHCDIPDLMSTQNVATYGGLCALATFDRSELNKEVISSSSFKLFLELDPSLREALFNFYNSNYGACLKQLEDMKDNLLLDMYLARHIPSLYTMIRNRALIQYFSPYLSADLKKMAVSFNTSVQGLEDELMNLILDGQIKARIDSHNKVLYAQNENQRNVVFEDAMEMGKSYQRRCKMLILRSAILKNNIQIKAPSRDGPAGNGSEINNRGSGGVGGYFLG